MKKTISICLFCLLPALAASLSWEPTLPFNAKGALQVKMDASGNAIALVNTGQEIQTAKQLVGSTRWNPTHPLSFPSVVRNPQLAVNGKGHALAVWEAQEVGGTTRICGAKLGAGKATWIPSNTPLSHPLHPCYTPDVGLDERNSGVAIWQEGVPPHSHIRAARINAGSNQWIATSALTTSAGNNFEPKIQVNKRGDAIALWKCDDGWTTKLRAARLPAGSKTWKETENFASFTKGEVGEFAFSLDCYGNCVVVYVATALSGSVVQGARLPAGRHSWEPATDLLAPPVFTPYTQIQVATSPLGDAIALWAQPFFPNGIYGSMLPPHCNTWIPFPKAISPLSFSESPKLARDDFGNSLAVWSERNTSIHAATLAAGKTSWTQTDPISNQPGEHLDVTLNKEGTVAVVIWQEFETVRGAYTTSLFPDQVPLPPQTIRGEQIRNSFAIQTERFNRIFWAASPSTFTASYEVYKNGNLVKTIPASGNFIFEDHNVEADAVNVYEVFAVSSTGVKSSPVTLVL